MTVRENITTPSLEVFERYGIIRRRHERRRVDELVPRLNIRVPHIEAAVAKLSGGNQQKVIVTRSLVKDTKVFIFHEMTRGIDVGAKIEVYKFVQELANQGAGIIYISSELAELMNLTHRIIVMRSNQIANVFDTANIDEEHLLRSYFGWKAREEKETKD
jgi:ABC-type sugar transport system ATPase subunit